MFLDNLLLNRGLDQFMGKEFCKGICCIPSPFCILCIFGDLKAFTGFINTRFFNKGYFRNSCDFFDVP